jgi:outer membrane protein assembly factor BamB
MPLSKSNRALSGCLLVASVSAFSCGGSDIERPGDSAAVERLWYTPAQDVPGWPGAAAVAGNTVLFGAGQGIAAFDVESGALRWSAKLWSTNVFAYNKNFAIGDGRACTADQFNAACVDVASGHVLWSKAFPTDSSPGDGESAYASNTWFYGARDHRVHAVDPATGVERWSTDIAPGAVGLTRIFGVSIRGDTLYATTVRWLTHNSLPLVGDLVALNRQTGEVIWTYTTPGDKGGFQGRALLTDRLAIVNDTYYHGLVAIDLQTGKEVWRTAKDESGFISSESTPVLVGDTVFAASADTQIYAVDAKTGAVLWRVIGDGNALGSVDACPKALIPVEFAGGHAFLVDRRSHLVQGIDGLPGNVSMSSRFSVVGDKVFAAGTGGVYAFQCR